MYSFKEFLFESSSFTWQRYGHQKGDSVWIWHKNELKVKVSSGYENHLYFFPRMFYEWKGRFDKEDNIISVMYNLATVKIQKMPEELKTALKQKFGNNIIFKPYEKVRI